MKFKNYWGEGKSYYTLCTTGKRLFVSCSAVYNTTSLEFESLTDLTASEKLILKTWNSELRFCWLPCWVVD